MSVISPIITMPTDGINTGDSPSAIGDYQAVSLVNLRMVGGSMESFRPSVLFTGHIGYAVGAELITDDTLIFRRKNQAPIYLFAHGGKVFASASETGASVDIGYVGTVDARIRLIQFQNYVLIFNGVDANQKYDGVNLWSVGIVPPTVAPVLGGPVGTLTRDYYYTYFNENDLTESNPSPLTTSNTCTDGNVDVGVVEDSSAGVQTTKIRIYRTGVGIVEPRLAKTVANVTGTYNDDSSEVDVALSSKLAFDHDVPPIFADGWLQNNRLFAWGGINVDLTPNTDTLWVSNEYQPQYMPIIPFLDSEIATSGGPITINPGDGSEIMTFVPWGGAGIVFKENVAYRIQETEIGFYGYQVMPIPGCIARHSAKLTPGGVVWLSQDGWMLLDTNEQVTNFGAYVKDIVNHIDDFDLVSAAASRDYYITSFKKDDGLWYGLTFSKGAWQGLHSELLGSSYFTDSDGTLYLGRINGRAGISRTRLHTVGYVDGSQVTASVSIAFIDKAREYAPGKYSRIRKVRVSGRTLTRDAFPPPVFLNVYDENLDLLSTALFNFPLEGSVDVWLDSDAFGRYLAVAIEGLVTRPIRITSLQPTVEMLAEVRE